MIDILFWPVISMTPLECPLCGKIRNHYGVDPDVKRCDCPIAYPAKPYAEAMAEKQKETHDGTP